MSEPEIRLARPEELVRVGALTVAAYRHDGHLDDGDDYLEELADATDRSLHAEVWVAVIDATVVGTVTFCPPGSSYRELAGVGEGEFRMLGVSPEARGRGVARALVTHCLERSRALGLGEVVLCSMDRMSAAHALYESLGFRRDETLDWEPGSGVVLWGYRLAL